MRGSSLPACARSVRLVAQRLRGSCRGTLFVLAVSAGSLVPWGLGGGRLGDAVGDEVQDVEARHALLAEQCCGVGAGLAQERREDVAHVGFAAARTLDVEDGRLEHAAEGEGLEGLPTGAGRELLQRLVEEGLEVRLQPFDVGARAREHLGARGIVGQRVQQVLQRQLGMTTTERLTGRHGQDTFQRLCEQGFRPPRCPREGETPRDGPTHARAPPWSRPPPTDRPRKPLVPFRGPRA